MSLKYKNKSDAGIKAIKIKIYFLIYLIYHINILFVLEKLCNNLKYETNKFI